jgi:hypothetical protein
MPILELPSKRVQWAGIPQKGASFWQDRALIRNPAHLKRVQVYCDTTFAIVVLTTNKRRNHHKQEEVTYSSKDFRDHLNNIRTSQP